MVLSPLAALALCAPAQDGAAPLPGAPAIPSVVSERLARTDAADDEFAHERLVTALADRLAEALPEPNAAGSPSAAQCAALAALFGDVVAVALPGREVPSEGAPAAVAPGPVRVRFDVEPGAEPASGPSALPAERLDRAEAAARVASAICAVPGAAPWKKKVLRAERLDDGRIAMRILLSPRPRAVATATATATGRELRDRREHGRLELAIEWHTRGPGDARAALDASAWQVAAVTAVSAERIEATHGLEDVSEYVLSGSPRSRDQLVASIGTLGLQLDASLGLGFLGHHGVAVGDINGDGLDDVYLCQPGGLPDQVWVRRADGTAVEVAAQLGLDLLDSTRSALFVDLDNDGDQDLVRATGHEVLVHVNRGGGKFPVAFALPIEDVTSLAAADVDLDGRLDLFLCTYGSPYTGSGLPVPYHDARNGTRNALLANRSAAVDELRFEDVTDAAGMGGPDQRFSFAASFADFDGDGDADLYVANDFGRNHLWRNERTPEAPFRFVDVAAEYGVEDVAAGMGVTWADFDLDGRSDVYVSNMFSSAGNRIAYDRRFHPGASEETLAYYRRHAAGNSLFLQRDGAFEFTDRAGLGLWAWGGLAFELDGDGRPDLYVPNGFLTGTNPDDL